MQSPILIQTPQEKVVSYVTFYDGTEEQKKDATVSLLTSIDFNDEGQLLTENISYIETPFLQLPSNLQTVLKETFDTISNNDVVIMRLFKEMEEGVYTIISLQDEEGNE